MLEGSRPEVPQNASGEPLGGSTLFLCVLHILIHLLQDNGNIACYSQNHLVS